MATKTPQNRLYVRPSPEARHALQRLLTELQAPSRFGSELTQEDLVAATWLWMARMSDTVAAEIGPHLEAVRAWRLAAKGRHPDEATPSKPDVESIRIVAIRDQTDLHLREAGELAGPKKGKGKAAPKGKGR